MPKSKSVQYIWWKDRKIIGTITLLISITFLIFAFLNRVPVVSTIYGYTIGMLLGWYNPLFFAFTIFISLEMIFEDKFKIPSFIKFNNWKYGFFSISIIFIGSSIYYMSNDVGFTSIGRKPWNTFSMWYEKYTDGPTWAPNNTHGGVLGVFLYSLVASAISTIGTLVLSIILLVLSISILLTGSFVELYRKMISKKSVKTNHEKLKGGLVKQGKNKDIEFKIENNVFKKEEKVTPKIMKQEQPEPKREESKNDFPFEDPFA